mgnify:CR=1 FL=1
MLLAPIAEVAKTWIGGKVEVAKAKSEANLATTKAKAEVMKKVAAGELDWNQTMAEAFTGHEAIVTRGFAALEAMPDFYKTAVGVVFAASFGIQSIKNMMNKK